VGTIAKDVGDFKVGDRVSGFTRGGALQNDNGAFADYIATKQPIVWRIPEGTTFEQAAAIGGIPVDTAAQALYTRLDIPRPWSHTKKSAVSPGDSILIWSGAASVSYYAIQMAKYAGLKVFTVASPHHHEALKKLGAEVVFDYRDPEVSKKIKEASNGSIKICLDGISEHGSFKLASEAMSDQGGKIVSLLGPAKEELRSGVEVVPTIIYSVLDAKNVEDVADIAEWHRVLPDLVKSGALKPHNIDHKQGGLESIHQGLAELREGKVSGKRLVYSFA